MPKPLPLVNHVSIGTNNLIKALSFYDAVMATLGAKRIIDEPNIGAAYGRQNPEFWVQKPHNQLTAQSANGVHFGFWASSIEEVDAFYTVAIENGATSDGKPAIRPEYSESYYGCFVYDLDGHKIEAMFWDQGE